MAVEARQALLFASTQPHITCRTRVCALLVAIVPFRGQISDCSGPIPESRAGTGINDLPRTNLFSKMLL